MLEISIEEYQQIVQGKNKYGAKKTRCDSKHIHDSKKEADRCNELTMAWKGGAIKKLKQQPKFTLLKAFSSGNYQVRGIVYRADFAYIEEGVQIVEDVKGKLTDVYKLKKKLFLNKIKNTKIRFIET